MKCAVITPIGPGHELFALDAEESLSEACVRSRGPFADIAFIRIDDTRGELGRSAARNQGVRLAQQAGAEWVFFLDADDVLCPDVFSNAAQHLSRYDAVWGGIYELAADEDHGVIRAGQVLHITRIEQLLANDPFITLQIGHFVKTAAALATPFDPDLDAGEDFDYYLRLWSQFNCIKMPAPFFFNRRNTYAGGPRAATDRDWRVAVERIVCAKCVVADFYAEFRLRGESFRFYIDNPFDPIQRSFLKDRFFGAAELACIEDRVGQGAHIVEVGANVGNHVVYYARFMHPSSVIVLESNPAAIGLLRRNLAANAVTGAELARLGIALADAPLDELIAGPVDFMHINMAGMELEALAGARGIIARWRPQLMVALSRPHIARFEQWLALNGYGVERRFEYEHAVNFMLEPTPT